MIEKCDHEWTAEPHDGAPPSRYCFACGRYESEVELQELYDLVEKQRTILTEVANALKGPPPELASHSHHDLADVAKRVVRERDYIKADFDSLEYDASALIRAWAPMAETETDLYSLCPTELREAFDHLRDNGRDGWWEKK